MIDDVCIEAPLENSDHAILKFEFECRMEEKHLLSKPCSERVTATNLRIPSKFALQNRKKNGLLGDLHRWIESSLKIHCVVINNTTSKAPVTSGIPQDSVSRSTPFCYSYK